MDLQSDTTEDAPLAGPSARILFVSLCNDLGSERIVSEMVRGGIECGVVCPKDFYCASPTGLARHFVIPGDHGIKFGSIFVKSRLEAAVREWRPSLVLPLDDLSAWLLRGLAVGRATSPALKNLLVESLGAPSGYSAAISRVECMNVVEALGLRKPLHCVVTSHKTALATASEWGYPVVIKTDHTSGGAGVGITRNSEELLRQLVSRKTDGWLKQLKLQFKEGFYHLAGFRHRGGATTLQSFVPGVPAFRTVAAWKGRVLDGISFVAEQIHPEPTGASTVVRHIENAEMNRAAAEMVSHLKCSGFVSFDFVLDQETGHASLIEMNPRSINTTHLGQLFGADLWGALVSKLAGTPAPPQRAPMAAKTVALFPKEVERAPHSPHLRSSDVYHDMPVHDLGLMRTYLRRLRTTNPVVDERFLASLADEEAIGA